MAKREDIEKICEGKAVRIFGARTDRNTVSFVESYRNCGRKSCLRCRDRKNRPHGPYWNLNYPDSRGRTRTIYVGRKLPALTNKQLKVSFAEVYRYFQEVEEQKETIARHHEEVRRLKREIEALYEQMRQMRRSDRKRSSTRADKFFRQLVLKYHPDRPHSRHFTADDVMKDINQLYQQLVKS